MLLSVATRRHFSKLAARTMTKPTTLIIEQLNIKEEDPSKFQYKLTPGTTSFNDFILSYPSGAYTGMRTVNRDAVVELHTHMKRMTNSLEKIKFEGKTSSETTAAHDALSSLRDPQRFETKVVSLLRKGLQEYYDHVDSTTHTEYPSEAKISLMATYSFDSHQAYFAAHFAALPSIPPNKRIKVEVERKARTAPEVKDSQWVRDRQGLEKNKPKDVNEVVLMDNEGQLYEGMASNFFAVVNGAVVCASLDHVLFGSIMKIVIEVCKKHDIPIKWEFPKLEDAKQGKWEGCFLTSTSRLLLPIESMYVDHQSIEFKESSTLIEFLRKQVANEIYESAYKILVQ